jgi:predicted PurR-regulated permease PerM
MPDYSNMPTDPSAMMAMMGPFLIVALVIAVFMIFCWWRIFSKAGYSGALALVFLAGIIPLIGPLICLALFVWFAFVEWPVEKKAKGGAA